MENQSYQPVYLVVNVDKCKHNSYARSVLFAPSKWRPRVATHVTRPEVSVCGPENLHCCEVFKMRERHDAEIKNEIMNVNQGDHVTFVWSWRRSKQRLSFCRTFHPFIQHHDAGAVHRRTPRSPDVTLLTQARWYGLSGFEFPVAGQLCFQNVTHACQFAKCTTSVQYI